MKHVVNSLIFGLLAIFITFPNTLYAKNNYNPLVNYAVMVAHTNLKIELENYQSFLLKMEGNTLSRDDILEKTERFMVSFNLCFGPLTIIFTGIQNGDVILTKEDEQILNNAAVDNQMTVQTLEKHLNNLLARKIETYDKIEFNDVLLYMLKAKSELEAFLKNAGYVPKKTGHGYVSQEEISEENNKK